MRLRRIDDFYFLADQECVPGVHIFDSVEDEADMIKPLVLSRFPRRPVQRQVVIAVREVAVVTVGPPLDTHAHDIGIKADCRFEVARE